MDSYCHYHPLEPSEWYCSQCQHLYCGHCVVAEEGDFHATCPICHQSMGHSGSTNRVTPFWQSLSEFFAYPLAKDPIVLVALCTLVPAVLNQGLIALVVGIVLLCAQTKYMYKVIEETAVGDMKPPALGEAFSGGGLVLVIQQTLVFAVMGLAIFAAGYWLGQVGLMIMVFLVALSLPASIMILATEHQLGQAVSPTRLLGIISAIGWPYMVMCGYLMLLMLGLGAVQDFVIEHFSASLAFTITGFTTSYFLLVIFCMMGYVLHQYQPRLGTVIQHSSSAPRSASSQLQQREKLSQIEIDMALKDGRYDVAIEALVNHFSRKPHDLPNLDRLFRLLMLTERWDVLDKKSLPVLRLLIDTGRIREIRQMLRGLYAKRANFEVRDPEAAFHVAQSLYHAGDYRLLLRVLQKYGERFKDAPHQVEVLMLMARALANGLHDGEKSSRYLRYIAKEFPADPVAARVPEMLEQLKKTGRLPDPKVSFG